MRATKKEVNHIEKKYAGRTAYFGELHNHAASGGTSDGMRSLEHWRGAMEALKMDFAAILDHKQVRHMYIPQWKDGTFIGGTEPEAKIVDADAETKIMHYNMIFENAEPVMELLAEFPEYEFTGGPEGHFIYPPFTRARFRELAKSVFDRGGFFVHPHPTTLMTAKDPLQYVFCDGMGLEVIYFDLESEQTKRNYKLWTDILSLGRRIFATAGCDRHACCQDTALTTIYSEEKKNSCYIEKLRAGDFVAGSVGIKMCVGDTLMGGVTEFGNDKLICQISDFHRSVYEPTRRYRVDIINDQGICFSSKISCDKKSTFSLPTSEDAMFYRAEVFDVTKNLRIAIGNPIWNVKKVVSIIE